MRIGRLQIAIESPVAHPVTRRAGWRRWSSCSWLWIGNRRRLWIVWMHR